MVFQVRTAKDGHVLFIGVVNMMPHKCMINGGTVVLARRFSPTTLNGLRGPCDMNSRDLHVPDGK